MFANTSEKANELVTWLRGKTLTLAKLRAIQTEIIKRPIALSPIRPGITRWTSHFLAMRRLLELREALQVFILDRTLIRGKVESRIKAEEMYALIANPTFWYALSRLVFEICPKGPHRLINKSLE